MAVLVWLDVSVNKLWKINRFNQISEMYSIDACIVGMQSGHTCDTGEQTGSKAHTKTFARKPQHTLMQRQRYSAAQCSHYERIMGRAANAVLWIDPILPGYCGGLPGK